MLAKIYIKFSTGVSRIHSPSHNKSYSWFNFIFFAPRPSLPYKVLELYLKGNLINSHFSFPRRVHSFHKVNKNGAESKYHYENFNNFSWNWKCNGIELWTSFLFQTGGKSDYSDLMSLVQAQQTRLQSQQAEIKHVSIIIGRNGSFKVCVFELVNKEDNQSVLYYF